MRGPPDEHGVSDPAGSELAHVVRHALLTGDDLRLALVLGPRVRVVVDSGGALEAATGPATGAVDGLRLLRRALGAPETLDARPHSVNGRTGLVCVRDGRVVGIVSFNGAVGHVQDVWVVLSSEKLAHWNRPN
jgi:hypothetical protein